MSKLASTIYFDGNSWDINSLMIWDSPTGELNQKAVNSYLDSLFLVRSHLVLS